jgi:hypothetical protein
MSLAWSVRLASAHELGRSPHRVRFERPHFAPRERRNALVPFSDAGSEMIGALLAGRDEVVSIKIDSEYVAIATSYRTSPQKLKE